MAKLKLGAQPKTFKKTITFPMLDGTTGSVEIIYIYRTRTEFGAFIDANMQAAGDKAVVTGEKFSMEAMMSNTTETNADYVLKVAEGWDVDAEFTHENIQQLSNEVPAACIAIMEGYRAAIVEGRLGN